MPELTPKIHIANPCHANWNRMYPAEQGRYCDKCKTVVQDFTSMSDQELIHFLQTRTDKGTCGRFREDQLMPSIYPIASDNKPASFFRIRHFFQLLLLPFLALFSFPVSAHVLPKTSGFHASKPGPTVSHYHPKYLHRKKHKRGKGRMGKF